MAAWSRDLERSVRRIRNTLLCLVIILALQLVAGKLRADDGDVLQKIKERAFRAAQAVTSFELSARVENSNGAVWQVRFLRDGQKYRIDRVDLKFAVRDGQPMMAPYTSWSFDGEIYQSYNARNGALKFSETRQPTGAADPALLPFRWVISILCHNHWTALENRTTWDKCFAKAQYVGPRMLDGRRCEVVEFVQECSGEACLFEVFFSDDHDGFPIRYERRVRRTGQLSTVFSVGQWAEIAPANAPHKIHLPLKLTHHENGKDGVSLPLKKTVSVAADVRINIPVNPQVYDLEKEFDIESKYHVPEKKNESPKRTHGGG